MRCVFRFGLALALGVALTAGCSEGGGEGGSGGGTGGVPDCQNAEDCNDDNDCTEDGCTEGTCTNAAIADGEQCAVPTGEGLCFEGDCLTECFPADERECASLDMIDPIEEMCLIVVPDQPNACDGTESIENPADCTPSGNVVTYRLTQMQSVPDCSTGYDLDGCYGTSCRPGALAQMDGMDGVDNGLAGAAYTLFVGEEFAAGCTTRLGPLHQAFHDAICTGAIDIEIEADEALDESCALITVSTAGVPGDPIPMNLTDDGCVSGTLGTIPIRLGDVDGIVENAVLRMTVSPMGFSDGIMGGTVTGATAAAVVELLCEGWGALAGQLFDINGELSGNVGEGCDSLSVTLEIGGDVLPAP